MKYEMPTIYSIGHGRHAWRDFLALLERHDIRFVADVRNFARSRWPQFNGPALEKNLLAAGIGYEHLPETGGKKVAAPEDLNRGVERLLELAAEMKTAMMCSESQPLTKHRTPRANCHRVGLLAPLLRAKGAARIIHLLPNGETLEFDETKVESIW
jgi:uncharacterized protein (DUF488 family)